LGSSLTYEKNQTPCQQKTKERGPFHSFLLFVEETEPAVALSAELLKRIRQLLSRPFSPQRIVFRRIFTRLY